MKESVNTINLEGIVSEVSVREISKEGKNYVAGEVVVQTVDKQGNTLLVPVSFISADTKKDGTPNKNYARLIQLKEFNSIASAGIENATKVQIRGAKMEENLFLPQGGEEVISTTRISSNFFTKITDANYNPSSSFNVTAYILAMRPEMIVVDGEETESGRLVIQAAMVGYNDRVDVFKFIVENETYINFVKANWHEGDTVQIGGEVRYTVENVERTVEVGFGDAETRTYTKRIKEFIVLRGSASPLEAEESYDEADIKAGLVARKARMEKIKNEPKKAAAPAVKPASDGFDF